MKFSKGEIAIVVEVSHGLAIPKYGTRPFIECEILDVGPYPDLCRHPLVNGYSPGRSDYVVRMPDGDTWFCIESSLRKRRPPEQPADDQEFINWCNTLGRDAEEVVRRTMRNMETFTQEAGRGS